jgi:hypothetical protein
MKAVADGKIRSMRKQGYSIDSICRYFSVTNRHVGSVLGNNTSAFANEHVGDELDTTGMFRKISTMRWV